MFSSLAQDRLFRLFGFVILCCVVPATIMLLLGYTAGPATLFSWLRMRAFSDSWAPIVNAIHFVDTHASGTGLYQATYFESSDQFIYTPQGLVFLRGIEDLLHVDIWTPERANLISWPIVPLMIWLAYSILCQLVDRTDDYLRKSLLILATASVSVLFFYPITKGYSLGQIQNWMTATTAISLILFMSMRMFWAGMAMGLTALIKPHVSVVLIWALARRNWAFAAGFLTPIALASLWSLAALGWSVHFEYLDLLSYLSKRGESFHASHSFESTLYRMIHDGNNLEWDGSHTSLIYVAWVHHLATALSALVILTAIIPVRGEGRQFRFLDYAVVLASIVIASPVAYDHHYGIVAFIAPAAALIYMARRPSGPIALPLFGAIGYALIAGMYPIVDGLADTNINMLQSYRLYGMIFGLGFLYWLRSQCRIAQDDPVAAGDSPPGSAVLAQA